MSWDPAILERVWEPLSPAARRELMTMGLEPGAAVPPAGHVLPRRAISAPDVLNEATAYAPIPSSFSRGLRVELPGASMLLLSGTSAVDESGATVHAGDFTAQCLRTYRNLGRLLESEGASWRDVMRTTCYLRDIDRDYATFNRLRTAFYAALGVAPLPASTAIEARLCRPDLLIEIEALALIARP